MGTVTNIDEARPHSTATITCSDCGHKWVAVYPAGTKSLECPSCHNAVNEFGVRILIRRCKTCKTKFTVCPAPDSAKEWDHCLSEDCDSYDETRDVDKLFDAGVVRRDDDDT